MWSGLWRPSFETRETGRLPLDRRSKVLEALALHAGSTADPALRRGVLSSIALAWLEAGNLGSAAGALAACDPGADPDALAAAAAVLAASGDAKSANLRVDEAMLWGASECAGSDPRAVTAVCEALARIAARPAARDAGRRVLAAISSGPRLPGRGAPGACVPVNAPHPPKAQCELLAFCAVPLAELCGKAAVADRARALLSDLDVRQANAAFAARALKALAELEATGSLPDGLGDAARVRDADGLWGVTYAQAITRLQGAAAGRRLAAALRATIPQGLRPGAAIAARAGVAEALAIAGEKRAAQEEVEWALADTEAVANLQERGIALQQLAGACRHGSTTIARLWDLLDLAGAGPYPRPMVLSACAAAAALTRWQGQALRVVERVITELEELFASGMHDMALHTATTCAHALGSRGEEDLPLLERVIACVDAAKPDPQRLAFAHFPQRPASMACARALLRMGRTAQASERLNATLDAAEGDRLSAKNGAWTATDRAVAFGAAGLLPYLPVADRMSLAVRLLSFAPAAYAGDPPGLGLCRRVVERAVEAPDTAKAAVATPQLAR